jgi:release factor glutamine methyltransferase
MDPDRAPFEPLTILEILERTTPFLRRRGSPSPRLDAELLLAHVLDLERIQLYTQFDRPLLPDELSAYREIIRRRAKGTPCAYLTGHRAFWTIELHVDSRVLIPRPDTETLVEAALKRVPSDDARIVDVGTGSGAIALALAAERPNLRIAATDLSEDALVVARLNAERLGLADRVAFLHGDLLAPLGDFLPADMILSNPPYIGESERPDLDPGVVDFEPGLALFSGADGLDLIRRLIPSSLGALCPGGLLLIEIGHTQGPAVCALFEAAGFQQIETLEDLGRRDRVVLGVAPENLP